MATYSGKVKDILEVRSGMKKNGEKWYMQDYVIAYMKNGFEKRFLFTVVGADRINSFSPMLKVGNDVTIHYEVEAHPFNGKWYNNVIAWKVESGNKDFKRDRSMDEAAVPPPQEAPAGDQMPF